MAGNKYNPPNAIHRPQSYKLKHLDKYGNNVSFGGTAKQIIKYILDQQL